VEGIIVDTGLLMRLISLEFEDPAAGWKLCEFEFFNDITLLVGLSGVGKTRILDTLDRLKAVAQGKTSQQLFGVQWSLVFEHDNSKYEWKGKMSEDPLGQERDIQLPFLGDDDEDSNRSEFLSESLIRNGSRIAQRDHEEIYFSENKTPKLSRRESVISLFKNEDLLKPAYSGMQMILSVDHSEDSRARNFFRLGNLEPLKKKFVTVEAIRATDMPTHVKLALAYANCPEVFQEIVRQFRDAFPAVDRVVPHS
jgi:predicted ATPase